MGAIVINLARNQFSLHPCRIGWEDPGQATINVSFDRPAPVGHLTAPVQTSPTQNPLTFAIFYSGRIAQLLDIFLHRDRGAAGYQRRRPDGTQPGHAGLGSSLLPDGCLVGPGLEGYRILSTLALCRLGSGFGLGLCTGAIHHPFQ